ncbi:hypothetical protein ASE86_00895 [Sphingomonas sp. Leaf33]|uniref:ribbon-helix-helix protein, CopG family n=1 Tax=Sphingomonas sp. Leaf33 TaxID=1736215 RepID=UPI0006FB7B5C|nr:ribbon-helix-helix protein, CopG family [Sphingomonas sp. Leaf33]KQN24883.1 hypothetical protein ASE86_00895 [Sphingomonas sp. Leaf33]
MLIRDEQVVAKLDALAKNEGRSRAAILKDALMSLGESVGEADERSTLFTRDRVTCRPYSI